MRNKWIDVYNLQQSKLVDLLEINLDLIKKSPSDTAKFFIDLMADRILYDRSCHSIVAVCFLSVLNSSYRDFLTEDCSMLMYDFISSKWTINKRRKVEIINAPSN